MERQTDLRQKTYKEAKAEIPYDLQKLKRTETETKQLQDLETTSRRYATRRLKENRFLYYLPTFLHLFLRMHFVFVLK